MLDLGSICHVETLTDVHRAHYLNLSAAIQDVDSQTLTPGRRRCRWMGLEEGGGGASVSVVLSDERLHFALNLWRELPSFFGEVDLFGC